MRKVKNNEPDNRPRFRIVPEKCLDDPVSKSIVHDKPIDNFILKIFLLIIIHSFENYKKKISLK